MPQPRGSFGLRAARTTHASTRSVQHALLVGASCAALQFAACAPKAQQAVHGAAPGEVRQPANADAQSFSRAFTSVRMGVTNPPTAANLETLVLLMSEGMTPADAGKRVFGADISWQTEATGEVWGTAEWAAAALEVPNAAHPYAPGRAVAGETRTVEWTGPDMLDVRVMQRGDASIDPQTSGILRARKDHWGMARDPARGFVEIVTERSPEKISGAPIVSAPSGSVTATLDGAVLQELAFEGRRGQRAQVVSARTRGTPSRTVWAGWWGIPGAPFVQLVIGSAVDADRQVAPQATPDDIATLYITR